MSACNKLINRHRQSQKTFRKLKMRVHLNADAMIAAIRKDFDKVPDHRARNVSGNLKML
jgi:hypothetical protein